MCFLFHVLCKSANADLNPCTPTTTLHLHGWLNKLECSWPTARNRPRCFVHCCWLLFGEHCHQFHQIVFGFTTSSSIEQHVHRCISPDANFLSCGFDPNKIIKDRFTSIDSCPQFYLISGGGPKSVSCQRPAVVFASKQPSKLRVVDRVVGALLLFRFFKWPFAFAHQTNIQKHWHPGSTCWTNHFPTDVTMFFVFRSTAVRVDFIWKTLLVFCP